MEATLVQFSKLATNDEQRLVFGLASVAVTADGETVTDLQGDQISQDELESAFYDYVLESREGDAMHDQERASTLVESFVVTPEKLDVLLKALGHEGAPPDFKGVAAWVGYKVHREDVWKRVKAGELCAFSIEGTAERVPVEKMPPWHIVERDGEYLVVGTENGKVYGKHPSREKAVAHLRALYVNVPEAREGK